MRCYLQKRIFSNQNGFTIIELIVVVAIMVILATVMVINISGQRANRDIKIAQNQLVSNIRKIQGYTLSSRTEAGGLAVQFYIMKFDMSKPDQYTIQAVYNAFSSPQYLKDIETVKLPINIRLAGVNTSVTPAVYPVNISRTNTPLAQNFTTTGMACAFVAFSAPFGKVFLNDGCSPTTLSSNPYSLAATDDYSKILPAIFVANTNCSGTYGIPFGCTASLNSNMTITLTNQDATISKTVSINGITGAIIFN